VPVGLLLVAEAHRAQLQQPIARGANIADIALEARRRRLESEVAVEGLRDERTVAQLALIRYKPNTREQIVIESKEELLKRGVKSPDRADSVMRAFAVRHDPVAPYIEDALRRLERVSDPELADQPPALGDGGRSVIAAYERTRSEIQNRLAKLRDRRLAAFSGLGTSVR
jgi:hypothetical protein